MIEIKGDSLSPLSNRDKENEIIFFLDITSNKFFHSIIQFFKYENNRNQANIQCGALLYKFYINQKNYKENNQ